MKQSLQLKQGLQLSLTPQLQQAIQLLQLNQIELQDKIQQMLESNPLLEQISEETNELDEHVAELAPEELVDLDLSDSYFAEQLPSFQDWEGDFSSNYSYENQLEDSANSSNLKQNLLWQLSTSKLNDSDRLIAYTIIDDLQNNGFLSSERKALYHHIATELDVSFDEFEAVRLFIQQFEPLGCASKDLEEFLLLQLRTLPKRTSNLQEATYLIKRHLKLLAQRDHERLRKRANFTQQQLEQTLTLIQSLLSEPYSDTGSGHLHYIAPDLTVTKVGKQWTVQLKHKSSSNLDIRKEYVELIEHTKNNSDTLFLQQNLQEARWFIRSLENRESTLLQVADKIMAYQSDFLEQGDIALKPLTLAQIASEIGMHESTISRATTGKYIFTPQGLFELKHFFSSQIATDSGEEYSSTAIRAMMKSLVEQEDPQKPYSDNKIVALLEEQGIQIARRTVAKYREELAIPPSSQRKRLR